MGPDLYYDSYDSKKREITILFIVVLNQIL